MHEPDIGVQHHRHRPTGHPRVPVRERDRVLFVQTEQDPGVDVAEMIDEAVVQAAKAGTRRERDVLELERAQEFRQRIAAEALR